MAYLNESKDFTTIATVEVRRAFLSAPESKELLKAHTRLYKWTQHPLVGEYGITPWWSVVDALKLKTGTTVPSLQTLHEWCSRLGVDEREYARVRSAVTEQWNTMSKPLFIELTQPVWAWIGKVSGQKKNTADPQVFLIGGNYQLWLPNLTIQHVKQIAALPYLQPR
ncbi:MAG TPA: hypothetical protein VIW68_01675 [Candidatus Sulfotelmatobacter sp.]